MNRLGGFDHVNDRVALWTIHALAHQAVGNAHPPTAGRTDHADGHGITSKHLAGRKGGTGASLAHADAKARNRAYRSFLFTGSLSGVCTFPIPDFVHRRFLRPGATGIV